MVKLPPSFFSGSAPITLVSGGAGFVGSFFCEALLGKKVKVICVDNWQTGLRENIAHLADDPHFFLLEHDISYPLPGEIEKVDYVAHLAGVEAYINGEDVSIETLESNSVGTKNLLDFSISCGAKFLLTSTIDVYFAKLSVHDASSYFGGSRAEEGIFSHHEAKRFAEALVSEYVQKHSCDGRIVRLGDVYGPRMSVSTGNVLARLIKACVYNTPVVLPSLETEVLYPVFVDDAVLGLVRSLLSAGTKGSIISLAGSRISALSLVQTVKEIVPNLEVQFDSRGALVRESLGEDVLGAGVGVISWEPQTALAAGMAQTLEWFAKRKSPLPEGLSREKLSSHKENPSVLRGGILLGMFVLSAVLFWLFGLPLFAFGVGSTNLYLATKKLEKGQYHETERWSNISLFWLERAQVGFVRWGLVPGLGNESVFLARKSQSLARTAKIVQKMAKSAATVQMLAGVVIGKEEPSFDQKARDLELELKALERELAFWEAEEGSQPSFLPEGMGVSSFRKSVLAASELAPHLGDLLGQNERKVYLLLLKDNTQLRPTGGVVRALGFLTFEKGRLVDIEVEDVRVVDEKLLGHVEPPGPLREYGGEKAWFLRDVSWSPDFPTSAARAEWFLDKSTGQQVNGVAGVDLEFIKSLLEIYGPVKITGGTVAGENFYRQLGSAGSLNEAVVMVTKKVFSQAKQTEEKATEAAKNIAVLFQHRHMSLTTDDEDVNRVLAKFGWDGAFMTAPCPAKTQGGCIADYVYPVDANVGKNDANKSVARAYSLDVFIKDNRLVHKLLVSYKSKDQEYRNYFRVFVPKNAENFSGVLVNSTNEEKDLVVDEALEGGLRSAGMFVAIPRQETWQLIVSWELPLSGKSLDSKGDLLLLWQKQAGTEDDSIWVKVTFPGDYRPRGYPDPSLTGIGFVGYNTRLDQDKLFNITWQKQQQRQP